MVNFNGKAACEYHNKKLSYCKNDDFFEAKFTFSTWLGSDKNEKKKKTTNQFYLEKKNHNTAITVEMTASISEKAKKRRKKMVWKLHNVLVLCDTFRVT